jgi:hypothetical protein
MKKMKYSILVFGMMFLAMSCSDDTVTPAGEDPKTAETTVVGVWNLASVEQQNGKIKLAGQLVSTFTSTSSNEVGTFEFKANGDLTNTVAYTSSVSTITLGQEIKQDAAIPQTTTTGTYVFDKANNKLTMTNSVTKEVQNADILELTANKLVFKDAYSRSVTQGGFETETSGEIVITLTR